MVIIRGFESKNGRFPFIQKRRLAPQRTTQIQEVKRPALLTRHLEILAVTLSAAKGLARWTQRSFAALRMTASTALKSAHGQSSLQRSALLRNTIAFLVLERDRRF